MSSGAPAPTDIETLVKAAQIDMIFARSRSSNHASLPFGLLVAWLLWDQVPNAWIVTWLVAKGLAGAWREWLAWRHARGLPDPVSASLRWGPSLDAAHAVDGLIYGLLATWLIPQADPVLQIVMAATVVGIGAVSMVVLSARFRTLAAFSVPVLLPGLVWQLLQGGATATYMGIGMAILLTLSLVEGRRASAHTQSMLRLRFTMDELAREREQALQLAERSNAAKAHFLATMSHEVRTPLHGILGLVRLLQGDTGSALPPDSAQQRIQRAERLRTIEKSGEHLLTIINDVLDHSRIEGGQLRLYEEPFDLVALVHEAVELQRGAALEKQLVLGCVVGIEAGARWVRGDAARVRQVLLNLLGNAIKFTPHGEVELSLQHTPEGLAEIEVSDSGPGVALADRERIFEPFEQLDASFARRHGGTGLGLSISRQLARAMRGDIQCGTSRLGGALFRLWLQLPACPAPAAMAAPAAVTPHAHDLAVTPHAHDLAATPHAHDLAATPHTPDLAATPHAPVAAAAPPLADAGASPPANVLLVEDNAVNALVAEASLHELGLAVTIVGDGHAAVAACTRQRYALVLMDCQLPGLDGFEATRRIRQAEQRANALPVPIVALTANALAGDRERSLAAGMDDHLAKPFTFEELQALVQRHLSR